MRKMDVGGCLICHSQRQLVRDHSHLHGNIRGILCAKCNSYLGVFEKREQRQVVTKSGRYNKWRDKYYLQICEHLKRDTGVKYQKYRQR